MTKHTWKLLSITLAAVLLSSCSKGEATRKGPDTADPTEVRALTVNAQDLRRNVESVGTLFPDEEVVISSQVDAECSKVLVDVGDRVTEGQAMVQLSPVELQLAANQQQAATEAVRARLGLEPGQKNLTDIHQAAEVKKADADLDDANQKFRRAKELLDQGLVPRQTYDEAESHLKATQASYDLAVQDVKNLVASLNQFQASSQLADKKLADAVIRAPFGGFVKERTVAPGQYVKVQSPVLTLVRVDPMRVRVSIPEKMAAWVKVGQSLALSVEAYPGRTFQAKLVRINPSVETQTRTFEAEALVGNPDGVLKPGFFVRATIPSDQIDRVLSLPESALNYAYGGYTVLLIGDGKLHQKEVTIGDHIGKDEVEVLTGLTQNQQVAVPLKVGKPLRDGAEIKVVP